MTDIEAFLLFLVYILPFGGIGNMIYGTTENDKSKIVLGIACMFTTLFIMGYLLYQSRKEKRLLAKGKKTKLFVSMFRQVIGGCVLMIIEFLILWHFAVKIRYIMAIICISLVLMTILAHLRQKL